MAAETRPAAELGQLRRLQLLDQVGVAGTLRPRASPVPAEEPARVGPPVGPVVQGHHRGATPSEDPRPSVRANWASSSRNFLDLRIGSSTASLRMTCVQNRVRSASGMRPSDLRNQSQRLDPVASGVGPLALGTRGVDLESGRRLAINPGGVIEQSRVLGFGLSGGPRIGDCLADLVLLDVCQRSPAQSAVVGGIEPHRLVEVATRRAPVPR